MKNKLLFIYCIVFSCCIINAQNYQPLMVDGNQWNELLSLYDNQVLYTHIVTIEGDSIVDGKTYKKLMKTMDEAMIKKQEEGLIREDVTERKVYFKPANKPESLIYDFNAKVGDYWLWNDGNFEYSIYIDSIGSIEINGVEHLQYFTLVNFAEEFNRDQPYGVSQILIEGIGCTGGLLNITGGLKSGSTTNLLCFFHDSDLLYKYNDENFPDCFYWKPEFGNIREKFGKMNIAIANNKLFVDMEDGGSAEINLINLQGHIVKRIKCIGFSETDITDMPEGVYIVRIVSEAGMFEKKIIL